MDRDPAVVLVLFIAKGRSPVWPRAALSQRHSQRDTLSLVRLFKPISCRRPCTLILMGAFLFMYHRSPTGTDAHRPDASRRCRFAALNIGGITGAVAFGRISEVRWPPGLRHDRDAHRHLVIPLYVLRAERHTPARRLPWDFRRRQLRSYRATQRALPDGGACGRRRLRVSRRRGARSFRRRSSACCRTAASRCRLPWRRASPDRARW